MLRDRTEGCNRVALGPVLVVAAKEDILVVVVRVGAV